MTTRAWTRHGTLHPDRNAPPYASLDDAYEAGRRAGADAAEAQLAADVAAARRLIARLEVALGVDVPSLAPQIERCVLDLVAAVVGEMREDGAGVRARVDAALAALGADAQATVMLHPADIALLGPIGLDVQADPELSRGDIRIVSGDAELLDRLAARLDTLE